MRTWNITSLPNNSIQPTALRAAADAERSTDLRLCDMEIRTYSENDRLACLDILDENTPEYFATSDRDSLDDFLGRLPGPYFVAEEDARVIACGGWAMTSGDAAVLTWGMVRRALHRQGIGRSMLRFRLESIKRDGRASIIEVHTVQLVQGFFSREGFKVVDVVPDGFGRGLDRVNMELQLRTAVEHGVAAVGRPQTAARR